MELTRISAFYTSFDQTDIDAMNANATCGITDWELGVLKNVTSIPGCFISFTGGTTDLVRGFDVKSSLPQWNNLF